MREVETAESDSSLVHNAPARVTSIDKSLTDTSTSSIAVAHQSNFTPPIELQSSLNGAVMILNEVSSSDNI